MPIDYMQMLLDLMEERQRWANQRDEAIREISRLSELIRATMNMVPAEQLARYEPIFERIEQRPLGLSLAIRACFTAGPSGVGFLPRPDAGGVPGRPEGDGWLTPVEIRDALKDMGFPFENYKANPLASIHTTLKRMVPSEMETRTLRDGQKVYRLKSAGEWARAFTEARDWIRGNYEGHMTGTSIVGVRRREDPQLAIREQQEHRQQSEQKQQSEKDQKEKDPPQEGKKRGTTGST
jgi:hypothetical protein